MTDDFPAGSTSPYSQLGSSSPEDELVARALEALDEGGEAALGVLLADHPVAAEAVRARVEHLRSIGLVAGSDRAGPDFPERLGEFRLVERIGGGGMGVVYLAVQESLGREVALKLIRPDLLCFEGARERFQREIEIVARLQHPGIVPIHTVGSAAGLPFFAMEFVRGCTLDAALEELAGCPPSELTGADLAGAVKRASPGADQGRGGSWTGGYLFEGSWEDTCLLIAQQVAEALEHAHQRGVIHRDVKPSNVMITPTSRLMLLDFGLSSMESDRRLTASNSHLGTLDYLPPEALSGGSRKLDCRADVYSLGVLLYQLFTGRPPYRRDTSAETITSIIEGRPLAPRKLAPRLSWEAETVCLAAMERDPERRYASAADFARDLQNVLLRRPVEARRSSVWLRTRRWVQRHPAASVAILLGSTGALGVPTLDAAHQRELVRQQGEQLIALGQAQVATEAQRARAEKNLARAMEAVDRFLTRVGSRELAEVPQMESLRRTLLEDAVEFQRSFLEDQSEAPEVRLEAAKAQRRLANMLVQLGRVDEAEASHRASIELTRALAAERPDNDVVCIELASAQVDLGKLLGVAGRLDEAEQVMAAAVETLDGLLAADPSQVHVRAVLVIDLFNLGYVIRLTGRLDLARVHLARAAAEQRWLVEHDVENIVRHRSVLANILVSLTDLPEPSSGAGANDRSLEQALLETVEQLAAEGGSLEAFDRAVLAASRCLLASQIASRGEFAAAREHGLAAREGLKDLVGLFPQTLDYQGKLARAEQLLGEVAASSGEPALAREHFQAADHTWRPLTAGPEPRPEYCARHASVLESLAEVVAELHGSESQAELLGRAADLRREALQPFPEHTDFRAALAGTLRRLLALEPSSSQGAEELRSELAELEGSGRSGV